LFHRKGAEIAEECFLFYFPLRGRKIKYISFATNDSKSNKRNSCYLFTLCIDVADRFSFAVLSTAKEKIVSLCTLVFSEAGGKKPSPAREARLGQQG